MHFRKNSECNQKIKELKKDVFLNVKSHLPDLLKDTQFCADNNLDQEEKTCKGDSGGPSIIRPSILEDKFTIIGITSGGLGGASCSGKRDVPDWYTFVAHHEVLVT